MILLISNRIISGGLVVCCAALVLGFGSKVQAAPTAPDTSAAGSGVSFRNLGIRLDVGYTYDDNVSRAYRSSDRLSDQIYSINLSKGVNIPLGEHTRLSLNGFVGGEKFNTYTGLDRLFGGGQGEFQYRSSGEFGAPTFGIFMRATGENFKSELRDGFRYSAGVTLRKPLTDRINLFGALAYNVNDADENTFDTRDTSVRLNLDYAAIANSTLYLSGEYRHGDVVSSAPPPPNSIYNIYPTNSTVADDVFSNRGFLDYRIKAKTVLATLGYNLPLGPGSFDLSWRRVRSNATENPGYTAGGNPHYVVNQISIIYLIRF